MCILCLIVFVSMRMMRVRLREQVCASDPKVTLNKKADTITIR